MKAFMLAAALTLSTAPPGRATPGLFAAQCKTPVRIISRRIRIEKGRTTAVARDRVVLCTKHQYRLRASEGQTMSLNLVGDHTTLTLWTPRADMVIDGIKT